MRITAWMMGIVMSLVMSTAPAEVPGAAQVRTLQLDNGMRILVWPDRDIPNIALYNWVRVGSRNEGPGITGLAHFFEHMMFNGTSKRAPGEFDRIMEANGGANNAFTSDDVTVYQDWIPSSALEVVLELEADRLSNLAFDPKVVESERGVVYSERRLSVEDDPGGRLREQLQATAFLAHPYSNTTIGWPSDIERWTMEDLKSFFTTYYAPGNCTLVLVGDVDPDRFFALAKKYLGAIPKQPDPPTVRTIEPPQTGERRLTIEAETQTPLLHVAYHGPAAKDDSVPALELLLRVLTDGDSSRLHQRLVEREKLAISVDSYLHAGFDPGLAWFFLTLPAGTDVAAAERIFDEELARIVKEGITADELQKAKQLQLASFWRSLTTIDGKANALGRYDVLHGDYRKLFTAPETYDSVTVEGVLKAAQTVLRKSNRTVGVLQTAAKEGA